ncbi:MAG: VCBS repeat-containing protein [Verrucomicrobiota bacterium]|nr:VCBS repeat-containing protein [Verrucomicrobiota bacterium]
MHRSSAIFALLGISTAAFAQTPARPAGNLVVNGDFAQFKAQENLWDGVDAQNCLAGNRRGTYAVMESGRVGNLEMPLSVNLIDVNGDRLPDLVTADPGGFLRAYINSGTPTEPKFTHAEMVPIFLPRVAREDPSDRNRSHGIPKISLFDWNRRGAPDLIYGNYVGDIVMIANAGGAMAPAFPQPTTYAKARVPIAANRPWGNLFAPCAYDWNKDGRPDLLVGEGSYSANAVYVLLNQSSSSEPKFIDEQRYYLCYGDGREQLVPTVVDYNADGQPDVLVGDRKGTIGVHLNPGKWKPGVELPLATMITFGNTKTLGGSVAPHAADFNGDGLFDLLIGKANGRIGLAINNGTKTEPRFGPPVELKGTNMWAGNLRIPAKWTIDPGNNRGNLYAYISVDDEASPAGGKILKAGYFPSPNKVFKMVEVSVAGRDSTEFFGASADRWHSVSAPSAGDNRPTDAFLIRQQLGALETGMTYQLSFKVKGSKIEEGTCTLAYLGVVQNSPTKITRGERRSVKFEKDETKEEVHETAKFGDSNAWSPIEKTFEVRFKEKGVRDLETTTAALVEFKFRLPQYYGACEICDVQLKAKPAR